MFDISDDTSDEDEKEERGLTANSGTQASTNFPSCMIASPDGSDCGHAMVENPGNQAGAYSFNRPFKGMCHKCGAWEHKSVDCPERWNEQKTNVQPHEKCMD